MASVGVAQTNSGSMVFVYNNFQASPVANVNANTNAIYTLPVIQGWDVQTAKVMTNRQNGGASYHAANNASVVGNGNTNAVAIMVGGEFSLSFAQMGFTKGAGFLIVSNTNGTQAITFDLTNTQANTNAFYGDTSFTTLYALTLQNLCNIEGVSSNNGIWYVNGSATNGAVLGLNTNGSYAITANGGTVVLQFPQGIAIAASTCKVLCTPTNGGVLAVTAYGS